MCCPAPALFPRSLQIPVVSLLHGSNKSEKTFVLISAFRDHSPFFRFLFWLYSVGPAVVLGLRFARHPMRARRPGRIHQRDSALP